MIADLVINNGVVCSESGLFQGGLAIKDGVIICSGADEMLPEGRETYDAKGRLIFPGVVEPHAHLGMLTDNSEDFIREMETESRAAAQGGITTINTTTRLGEKSMIGYLEEAIQGEKGLWVDTNLYVAPATMAHLDEIPYLFDKGVSAFKFLMGYRGAVAELIGMKRTDIDTGYLYRAFSLIARLGAPAFAMVHCEDPAIFEYVGEKVRQEPIENYVDALHRSRPNLCEVIDLCKAAYLAREVNCPLYQVHISTKESVDQLAYFRSIGIDIIGETCLHYLIFASDDEMFAGGKNEQLARMLKVYPAVHEGASRERLWKGINDGLIHCVGTDHVGNDVETKVNGTFWDCMPGIGNGYSVLLPIMFSEGVSKRRISLDTLRKIMCENPAKAFGLYPKKGTLNVGADGDVVLIDPEMEVTIDYRDQDSMSRFSAYQGMKVKGFPTATFSRGRLVAENYKVVGDEPHGKLLWDKFGARTFSF